MDVEGFLGSLKQDPSYKDQIVHVHTESERSPQWGELPAGLHPGARDFLSSLGVSGLYRHQAEAVEAGLRGEDVLITTGPASGKSLCYQLPLLQQFLQHPDATALLIFPTKALARDQAAAWNRGVAALHGAIDPRTAAAVPLDGDASTADRRSARQSARLLVTNPEMLHVNLLPGHTRWSRFFTGLKCVVLDEVHVYSGFFGANMANVIRRLERVCAHYGVRPQFFCASATVGNAVEMAERITGRHLLHVQDDSSRAGSRTYVFWNPPRIKARTWRGRRSANVEAHEIMAKLVQRRVPTICFSKARNTAEMIYRYVRDALRSQAPALADRVIPYRGGYSADERREMERRLKVGEVLGVSATRALELGVDVGVLEACIVVGYPGTLNAFFQQAGRVGREGTDSVAILVGIDTPINQHIMQHPEFIFDRPMERAVVDRDNPFVVLGHLRCAAAEMPVRQMDTGQFGYAAGLALEVLEEQQKVYRTGDAWYHASSEQPSHEVRLRGYGDESTVVMDADNGEVVDRLDKFRALRIFYPGAIYFRYGDTYEMVDHDTERNIVRVRRVEVSYYTDPATGTSVDHVDYILDERPLGTGRACLGEVFAVSQTPVYEKVQFYTMDRISQHPIDSPPVSYEAMSFWLTTPPELPREVIKAGLNAESGMKGILYCVSRILPLFLTSDANDFDWSLGCQNAPWHTLFWYEFYLRGIGNAEQCYERLEEILPVTLEHLLACDCEDGCPNCTSRLITPYHVRNIELGEGTVESRRAAAVVLNSLLTGQTVDASLALLDAPRKRGQRFLPSLAAAPRLPEPHRMPLDDRTRGLMARKLERARLPRLPVGHQIDPEPLVGMPDRESVKTADRTDVEARSGHTAIRRSGDPFMRKLRQRLKPGAVDQEEPSQKAQDPPPKQAETPSQTPEAPRGGKTIQAGDSLAARALKRKRGKDKDDKGKRL